MAEKDNAAAGDEALQLLREPSAVTALGAITVLDLRGMKDLEAMPEAVGQCAQVVRLDVGGTGLQTLPEAVARMSHLEILFASGARFSELPPVLARCPRLQMVSFNNNQLTSLDCRCLPENLVWLIAAGNQITSLPEIGRLKHIRKLMLSHNQLTCDALAPAADITDLEMIRVAANRLERFPEALLRHPHLSWVAVGGNPFTEAAMEKHLAMAPAAVDFMEVALGAKLGSGAGATVYSGRWHDQDVAVKLWEGERFSDGTAYGERSANRVAGHPGHRCLVGVLGTFEEPHPGMLLEKIEGAVAAARPPVFSPFTVTRDLLPMQGGTGPCFTASAAVAIATAVANATEYLHTRGILHGDVYLHNTLVVPKAGEVGAPVEIQDVRLSDFGAAAAVEDAAFFALEARSFGWMLQDLLDMLDSTCPGDALDEPVRATLRQLRVRCAQEVVEELPTFSELAAVLRQVMLPTPSL